VRWYLQFPISYRDLERMLADRGVSVDHTTLFRWIQVYAPELDRRLRPHLRPTTGSRRVDETSIRVKGRWTYPYRAVDARGRTIDFRLSAKRDAAAARRFFRKALAQPPGLGDDPVSPDPDPSPRAGKGSRPGRRRAWRRARQPRARSRRRVHPPRG
jgi:transposase, IS6 family